MSATTRVKNGIYDLLASGLLITTSTDPTTLALKGEGEELLTIIFKFQDSTTDPNIARKEATVVDNTTLEILFVNYNNALGSFNKEPWSIGSFNHRKLYFLYVIHGLTDTKLKRVEYSFYLGEEVTDGQN